MPLSLDPVHNHLQGIRTRRSARCARVIAILFVVGCQPQDQIRIYKIAKQEAAASADRMLVGFVPRTENAWFFKLSGSADEVAPHVDGFRALLKSLRFDQREEPQWELPAGWQQQAGRGMRFATLQPTRNASVSVSVISLPMPQPVLPNVNRWRSQLGLEALEDAELENQIERLELVDGEAVVIDLTGQLRGGTMASPRSSNRVSTVPPVVANPPSGEGGGSWTYTLPTSWQAATAGSMTKAVFQVSDGERQAKLTVTVLGAAAAPVLPNVNRWRGQLGLSPLADVNDAGIKAVLVSDLPATYVDLSAPESAISPQAMLAVIVPHGDETWFFKLLGDAPLVHMEQQNFDTFLESVHLGSP